MVIDASVSSATNFGTRAANYREANVGTGNAAVRDENLLTKICLRCDERPFKMRVARRADTVGMGEPR
jgi:hypothetical protein